VRWIIDTDAGIDDALALGMPFTRQNYPNFHLEAITAVTGNVHVDRVLVNVGAVLDLLGQDVPFYRGCDRPMVTTHSHAEEFHGADGLGEAGLSHTSRRPEAEHAALAINRLARQHPGDLSICAIGPLTNVALACNLDPDLPARVARLIVMGGAWQAVGNQTPAAEFNIYGDPESAHAVFERFENIVVLPWETSLRDLWPFECIEALAGQGTPRAAFMGAMVARLCGYLRADLGIPGFPVPDPLAVAIALDETVIAAEVVGRMQIDVARGSGRGLSSLDRRSPRPNARVVTAVHRERALAMIESAWQ
jgi:purine nucleosidase